MKRGLGVCYYPEHWPEEMWGDDARRMADLGLTWVRIAEFAWARMEPEPGRYDWDWLDRAIDKLGQAGLQVVLGTPTATPPRWMLDRHPDMLAIDAEGRPRGFGSRRHYCFSHAGYREECVRIVTAMADRYGQHPAVAAWQTDNEYGCHDTTLSYSAAARAAFQDWLAERYGNVGALNAAWGNVFWSMDYDRFDRIELPNLTVTEPNPAHVMAFRRFSSDQVVRFNQAQVAAIRARSDRPVAHNYMGRVTEFDHFDVGADLEIASWDSYPLGFLEDRAGASAARQRAYMRQGDPDFQAFHHDLYRAVGRGRWWVMEQQPGPVNWAPYNPAPLPGMVRLWTWEAFAHGAEAVCYFRWRQAPFAQEQMHAGLMRPDDHPAPAFDEAACVARELADAPDIAPGQAPVALIFDYDAQWSWETQPHAKGADYFDLVMQWYRALRRRGQSVDILPVTARDLSGYQVICAPGLVQMPADLKTALAEAQAGVLVGPRAGARDAEFRIPVPLPPDWPGSGVCVSRVESLRPDSPYPLTGGGSVGTYFEQLEGGSDVVLQTESGLPVAVALAEEVTYVAGWLDDVGLDRLIERALAGAGLPHDLLPAGIRRRDTATERFWFNYGNTECSYAGRHLGPAAVLRETR